MSVPTLSQVHRLAQWSLVSLTVTSMFTAIHHLYRFGADFVIPALIIVLLPIALLYWFSRTQNYLALWAYGLLAASIIVGLGFIDGGLDHTLRAMNEILLMPLGLSVVADFRVLPPSELVGDWFYEGTGILSFIASLFATYGSYSFILARFRFDQSQKQNLNPAFTTQ